MFADPAVNLHFGHGFTSSAWFQSRDSMFAGNSPLYSLCLYPWIGAFGFDVVAVRGLNYVLILGVVATGLVSLKRLGLVSSPASRTRVRPARPVRRRGDLLLPERPVRLPGNAPDLAGRAHADIAPSQASRDGACSCWRSSFPGRVCS